MKEGGTDRGELMLWKLIQPYTIVRGKLCHPRHYGITGQCRGTIKVNFGHHAASELISIDKISHFDALSFDVLYSIPSSDVWWTVTRLHHFP